MRNVYLWRMKRHDQGTEGIIFTDGFHAYTLELPWKENQRNISCIPPGIYDTTIRKSPRFGLTYWVMKVPGRTYILIHSGNFAGDVAKGFKTHVNGCILLGAKMGYLGEQRAVLNSRITIRKFQNHMNNQPFKLHLMEAFL